MPCYWCRKPLGDVKVAVGWGAEVHPEPCYEEYLKYVRQIKQAHAESMKPRDEGR